MSQERHSSLGIHPVDTDDPHELLKRRQVARRMRIGAIALLVLLAIAGAQTAFHRVSTARALEASSKEQAKQ
ncbi:MAG TPA: efflux transporter periplasmic adaptor subunit, partial [Casimicrobiaceae bacterium]|nr:efflux transporter periplasmic adaptor subunit [Casimicrobiaceae bacterium]